jgi:molybdopterin molybdotransferase
MIPPAEKSAAIKRLKDDCFAHDGSVVTIENAFERVRPRLAPMTAVERIAIDAALGRALAEDLTAGIAVPPHDNAAVDGWAVRHADLDPQSETTLRIGPRIAAGHPVTAPLPAGEAARIFTGAPMPANADTVLMQEDCIAGATTVRIPPGSALGANRRRAGEDVAAGQTVLSAGRRLAPPDLGLLASLGQDRVAVRERLNVAIFSTGDELREPGTPAEPGTIFDSNRHTLKALLSALGCRITDLGILQDDPEVIAHALAESALGHHAIVTSGGMSSGEEDHVRAAVARHGRLDAWSLAIKPGRPVALGVIGGSAFLGLPGNPVAMAVTFVHVARPVLAAIAGFTASAPARFPVVSGFSHTKKAGRREYLRVTLDTSDPSRPLVHLTGPQGSGVLSSMVQADGLLELEEDRTGVSPGDQVAYLPLSEVMR